MPPGWDWPPLPLRWNPTVYRRAICRLLCWSDVPPIDEYLKVAPEICEAVVKGRPVVALETTILSHGMPYPDNVATALAVEEEIRGLGAIPATIAVIGGVIRVGLTADELELLGKPRDVLKLSRNDLAYALATGKHGATTVAATMQCASLAGIHIFATGGIGGVHRGAESSFDISADLEELASTPVIVVCAGAKALLDLPKTLEYLETRGVPVIGYRTSEFPAFWSRSSGLAVPLRMDSPEEVARLLLVKRIFMMQGGAVVCNPAPEADEIPAGEMEPVIRRAVAEAEQAGLKGKVVTPFLLARILELSQGRSLRANIALVKSNARAAAEIALAVSSQRGL
jgi:pseudouridine-5'-phosphate glycosidase